MGSGDPWAQANARPGQPPLRRRNALTVFLMSMATVMGPTPPGTGVIMEAIGETDGKSTSPTSRWPDFLAGSATRLIPTSITTAPGFTKSAVTNPGRPIAAISTSACLARDGRSKVREWQTVTVAFAPALFLSLIHI